MSRLDRLHRQAQARLQRSTGRHVASVLGAITLDSRAPVVRDTYARATAGIIAGGQRAAGQLALAYMAVHAPPVTRPDLTRALQGTLITPESPGAIVGLLRLWSLVDQEVDPVTARVEAGSFAANLAEGDLQAAKRAGLDEAERAGDVSGRWYLEPGPNACDWCQQIADTGARYLDADTVPFHNSCDCAPAFQPFGGD